MKSFCFGDKDICSASFDVRAHDILLANLAMVPKESDSTIWLLEHAYCQFPYSLPLTVWGGVGFVWLVFA